MESGDYPHVRMAQSEVSLYPHIWRPEGLLSLAYLGNLQMRVDHLGRKSVDQYRAKFDIWFEVTAWGCLVETCNEHLFKGRQVAVEGRLMATELP